MPRSRAEIAFFVVFAIAAAAAFPARHDHQDHDKNNQEPSSGLPFLQFTNDGIRVNFGGYHAEAGLGGLFGGDRGAGAGGGLHASAGTPSGAQASAGLGGLLGDSGVAGGGLQAKASLGNDGPAARSGIGGVLDANAPPGQRAQGVKFAESSAGSFGKSVNDQKNIQVIPRHTRKDNNVPSGSSTSFSATIDTDKNGGQKTLEYDASKEPHFAATDSRRPPTHVETSADAPSATLDDKQSYPARKKFRAKLRELARNNQLRELANRNNNAEDDGSDVEAHVASSSNVSGTVNSGNSGNGFKRYKSSSGGTLFDDIFNIPISALNAVNQLLKNNVG